MTEPAIPANFEKPKPIESLSGAEKVPGRPESGAEKIELSDRAESAAAEKAAGEQAAAALASAAPAGRAASISDSAAREKEVEKIISKGLEEIYLSLPPEKRAEFKRAGEEAAQKINKLLEKTKVNLGKIVDLIKKWLSLIPGVNRFFLEQEAKIRADEIIKLKK